jgi:translation initiation factor IF-2
MTDDKKVTRLSKAAREFNVGITTIVEFLHKKGHNVDPNPNTKLPEEAYNLLLKEYSSDLNVKKESEKLILKDLHRKNESLTIDNAPAKAEGEEAERDDEVMIKGETGRATDFRHEVKKPDIKLVGKIDLASAGKPAQPKAVKTEVPVVKEEPVSPPVTKETKTEPEATPVVAEKKTETKAEAAQVDDKKTEKVAAKKTGPEINIVGKIDLDAINKPKQKQTRKTEPEPKEAPSPEPVVAEEIKKPAAKTEVKPEEKPEVKTAEVKVSDEPIPAAEPKAAEPEKEPEKAKVEIYKTEVRRLSGPTVVGKIELPVEEKRKPAASSSDSDASADARKKKKRKRIKKDKERVPLKQDETKKETPQTSLQKKKKKPLRPEVNEVDVQKQVKETLARLTSKGKSKGSKYRRDKRDFVVQKHKEEDEQRELEKNIIKVTEFVSVNELASMMDIPVTDVIGTCMSLGLFVSINQRLDAETMALVAEEFGYGVEFVSADLQDSIREVDDDEADLIHRPPIVTVMGHVDHGKTKLLDYIRKANVIAGEAGGITQHIGAYHVTLDDGRQLSFLDTPGHEAFTAMRARGAQTTDVVIIVVAADDGVMPQTTEAINHASAAGVPIVFAINKIDKPTANPEKIKESLAQMNYLVEDWGGKYQSQEISAITGLNIDLLLDKVLLEAEMLDLKANPNKPAVGTVIESSLDKGRGYVATVLVKAGTLKIGDVVLAGSCYGHIKAMYNERGNKITTAGPAMPVLILGLNGAPQAGDKFNVMDTDREAKDVANKRTQLQREQDLRTHKHITLDEIGRRIAIGNFQELNIIVKGDVDGSVEALSDSLIKLSTQEIQVNIIHKAVGQISESDILLAAASNAIVVGFQVRPSVSARKIAEKEQIDVRLYSIIYSAIEEIKSAMEGMLSPEEKEEIMGTAEIREVFKITKVGTVAGCMVKEGKITRSQKVRIIRDGIVIYTGDLGSLKRFKEDVREVSTGYECGLNINNFNDIKEGDLVESFKITEVKKTL